MRIGTSRYPNVDTVLIKLGHTRKRLPLAKLEQSYLIAVGFSYLVVTGTVMLACLQQ